MNTKLKLICIWTLLIVVVGWGVFAADNTGKTDATNTVTVYMRAISGNAADQPPQTSSKTSPARLNRTGEVLFPQKIRATCPC